MQSGEPRELLRTRCTDGWRVITDNAIRIECNGILGAGAKLDVLPRAGLTGASTDNKMAGVLGKGGANTLPFSGMGKTLVAKMVVTADAVRAMQIPGFA